MDKLTVKQEKFRNDLFAGVPQRDAYKNHYSTKNMLPATIDREAFALAQNPKIATSLAEMRAEVTSATIATEIERQEKLTELYRAPIDRNPTPKEVIMAITEHNKMTKVYTTVEAATTVVSNFLFILSDGTRVSPKELMRVEDAGVTPP